jgi:hypothetical protein
MFKEQLGFVLGSQLDILREADVFISYYNSLELNSKNVEYFICFDLIPKPEPWHIESA